MRLLIYGFIFLPVAVLVLFSFQASLFPVPPFNGPSLRWYAAVLGDPRLMTALVNSRSSSPLSSAVARRCSASSPPMALRASARRVRRCGARPHRGTALRSAI